MELDPFFIVAAAWNILLGLIGWWHPLTTMRLVFGESRDDPTMILMYRLCCSMVLIFGLGYLLVATDPAVYPGLIILGIVAKLWISGFWFYANITGRRQWATLSSALVDTGFMLIFLMYLLRDIRGPLLAGAA